MRKEITMGIKSFAFPFAFPDKNSIKSFAFPYAFPHKYLSLSRSHSRSQTRIAFLLPHDSRSRRGGILSTISVSFLLFLDVREVTPIHLSPISTLLGATQMAPKGKSTAGPKELASALAKKRGGNRPGAGKKVKDANAPGFDSAAAPKRTQLDLADLLGQRFAKKPKQPQETAAEAGESIDWIEWEFLRHDGGKDDTLVQQRQARGGSVFYETLEAHATVLKKGPEVYFVDKDDNQMDVEADHERAEQRERNCGKLLILLEKDDESTQPMEPQWVTCGHVRAVVLGSVAQDVAAPEADGLLTATPMIPSAATMPKTTMPSATPDTADSTTGLETQGGGVQAASKKAAKPRSKGPEGAKGHVWRPKWLDDFKWLRTEPSLTRAEWEERPTEAPVCIFCVCCVTFPSIGHKDVLQKKKKEAVRSDKCEAHEDAAHARALARYEAKFGSLLLRGVTSPESAPHIPLPHAQLVAVEPPLANLIRTCITTVLCKSALRLIPKLVQLQRANGADILALNRTSSGVQSFLHAAAVLLRRRQNEKMIAAGMLSKMGDGSSDRKTTEQARGCPHPPASIPATSPTLTLALPSHRRRSSTSASQSRRGPSRRASAMFGGPLSTLTSYR